MQQACAEALTVPGVGSASTLATAKNTTKGRRCQTDSHAAARAPCALL
jgi:hypothetical protein